MCTTISPGPDPKQLKILRDYVSITHPKDYSSKPTISGVDSIESHGFTHPDYFSIQSSPTLSSVNEALCSYIELPPRKPGVYFISISNSKDKSYPVLYVGQAMDLNARILGNYAKNGSHLRRWFMMLLITGWDLHWSWKVIHATPSSPTHQMVLRSDTAKALNQAEDLYLNQYDFILNTVKNDKVRHYQLTKILLAGEFYPSSDECIQTHVKSDKEDAKITLSDKRKDDIVSYKSIDPILHVTKDDITVYKGKAPKGKDYKSKLQEIYTLAYGVAPPSKLNKNQLVEYIEKKVSHLK